MRGWIIRLGILAVIGVGGLIFRDRLSSNAGELNIGDCFDDPQGVERITDVQHHPCTERHTAEVIYLGKLPDGDGSFPTTLSTQDWVAANCVPAFDSFTGKTFTTEQILTIGYYQPSPEGWTNGDRDVVCYAARSDLSPMTSSVRKQ